MRSALRFLTSIAVLSAVAFSPISWTPAHANGFGGSVLVGDGEVFVGEAANQFRPGTVYIYRKTAAGWEQAATLTKPGAEVGDARRHTVVRRCRLVCRARFCEAGIDLGAQRGRGERGGDRR
jgi:hypothetical protein